MNVCVCVCVCVEGVRMYVAHLLHRYITEKWHELLCGWDRVRCGHPLF